MEERIGKRLQSLEGALTLITQQLAAKPAPLPAATPNRLGSANGEAQPRTPLSA